MNDLWGNVILGGQSVNQALNQPVPVNNQSLPNQLNYVSQLANRPASQINTTPSVLAQNKPGGAQPSQPTQLWAPGSGGPANPQGASIQALKDSNPAYANLSDQAILDLQGQQGNLRNEISSGWDQYINSLNDQYNSLGQQQGQQNDLVNSQYGSGVDLANTQKNKSLKDIANNISNAFQAGNVYLGSQGAGDSSAANQYSFALNKQASRQTGDLNDFVSGQIQQLAQQRDSQLLQVSQNFMNAQQQIKQLQAQGQLGKAQDLANLSRQLLSEAQSRAQQIQSNSQSQYNALVGWAANNSTNLAQLQQNIAGIPQALGQFSGVNSQGNFNQAPIGYGSSNDTTKQNNLFQNPSWGGF